MKHFDLQGRGSDNKKRKGYVGSRIKAGRRDLHGWSLNADNMFFQSLGDKPRLPEKKKRSDLRRDINRKKMEEDLLEASEDDRKRHHSHTRG